MKPPGTLINSPTPIKTFESLQYVSGPLEGTLDDWPAQIQDSIHAALERLAKRVQLPLAIVHSSCEIDYGDTKEDDRYFLRIIASEIVARDERFTSEEALQKAYLEVLQQTGKSH